MRKIICLLVIFMILFSACESSGLLDTQFSEETWSPSSSSDSLNSEEIPSSSPSVKPTEEISSSSPNTQPSGVNPFMNVIDYNTLDDLIKGISNDYTEELLKEFRNKRGDELGKIFESFITNIKSGSTPLYVPYYQGKEMEFINEEVAGNIRIIPADLYGLPWIIYALKGFGSVHIMYMDENIKAEANENGAPWLIKQINPNGNGEDAKPYLNYISRVEKEVVLQDRTVKALECQYEDALRTYTYIVYDDILITINTKADSNADEWLKEFSFEKMSLKEDLQPSKEIPSSLQSQSASSEQ